MRVTERLSLARAEARTRRTVTSIAVLFALLIAGLLGVRWVIQRIAGPSLFRPELAEEFFRRYVTAEGRVVRPENGSDTVSEGQAYAMLLAVALDDPGRLATVWRWTDTHLRRPDGLLSWRWADGRIADRQSAADADIDATMALLLASQRFGEPSYLREAGRMSRAILEFETIPVGGGRVLVAGPWARDRRLTNPSYFWPEAFARFERLPGDGWDDVRTSSVELASRLTSRGRSLPPDWAHIDEQGRPAAVGDPGRPDRGARYFLDAPRLLIRFAATCDPGARRLAAESWDLFDGREAGPGSPHAVDLVAGAATAHAAGEPGRADELLDKAERAVRDDPSYYGWAWVALGRAMLDPHSLTSCS